MGRRKLAAMRSVTLTRVSSVIGAVAGLAFASWAVAGQDVKDGAPAAATSQEAPELRPGEIVIRKTGTTKRVLTVTRPAEARMAATAPAPATVTIRDQAEDSSDKRGPRSVTIGYTVREPMEIGAGPQVYEGSPFLPYSSHGFGYYGYNSCLPSYGYGGVGYGGGCRIYGGGLGYGGGIGHRSYGSFGGRSSSATPSSAPITYARRAK
jgi:hypothetical protein